MRWTAGCVRASGVRVAGVVVGAVVRRSGGSGPERASRPPAPPDGLLYLHNLGRQLFPIINLKSQVQRARSPTARRPQRRSRTQNGGGRRPHRAARLAAPAPAAESTRSTRAVDGRAGQHPPAAAAAPAAAPPGRTLR